MRVEIVGFDTVQRIRSIKMFREIVGKSMSLPEAMKALDKIQLGDPLKVDLTEVQIEILLEHGFEIVSPTKKEIKELMNQLIQKFLALEDTVRAKQLITMWIELIREEDDV